MHVVVAMSSEHRFAHRWASPSFADLAWEPFVHYHVNDSQRRWLDKSGGRSRGHAHAGCQTRHPNTAALLAAAGLGLALVPISAVTPPFPGYVRLLRPRLRRDIIVLTKGVVVDPLEASLRDELVTRGMPRPAVIAGQLTAKRRQ
jgi:DNA-binding transcriptional LysR family regulator